MTNTPIIYLCDYTDTIAYSQSGASSSSNIPSNNTSINTELCDILEEEHKAGNIVYIVTDSTKANMQFGLRVLVKKGYTFVSDVIGFDNTGLRKCETRYWDEIKEHVTERLTNLGIKFGENKLAFIDNDPDNINAAEAHNKKVTQGNYIKTIHFDRNKPISQLLIA